MRKIVVANIMSLDGFFEGPDPEGVMALPMDDSFDAFNVEHLQEADVLLLGRTSYDGFKSFWPTMKDNEQATPNERAVSQLDNEIQKVVISDTLTPDQTDPWTSTTRIVGREDALSQLGELKEQDGKDILVFGSRTLWNDLLAHGLVDELHLMIGAVALGDGTPIFDRKHDAVLETIDVETRDNTANVVVRYRVSKPD